jgi:hypothetical protein
MVRYRTLRVRPACQLLGEKERCSGNGGYHIGHLSTFFGSDFSRDHKPMLPHFLGVPSRLNL